jgi:hypothetical protein
VRLFSAAGDAIRSIAPVTFADDHAEERIQSWADLNPALINDGQPMISLGREILTQHGHAVDNLFIDVDGVLVAAEMKRGKSPRDVVAQMVDYAAFVSRLEWEDLDRLCRKRQGLELSKCFAQTFGHPLITNAKPKHRLLIVAESFDPRTIDAAVYLLNSGVPLILVEFKLFKLGAENLVQVNAVLGEFPKPGQPSDIEAASAANDGYAAWLLSSIGQTLPKIAEAQGWPLQHRVGKQAVPFNSAEWPIAFGECQFRVDLYKSDAVALRFSFRDSLAPGLKGLLEAKENEWNTKFPAKFERPAYEAKYVTLTQNLPRPELGDQKQLSKVLDSIAQMTDGIRPLVDSYFATKH